MNNPKVYDAIDGKLNCDGVQYSINEYLSILASPWRTIPNELNATLMNKIWFHQMIDICLIFKRIGFYDLMEYESKV